MIFGAVDHLRGVVEDRKKQSSCRQCGMSAQVHLHRPDYALHELAERTSLVGVSQRSPKFEPLLNEHCADRGSNLCVAARKESPHLWLSTEFTDERCLAEVVLSGNSHQAWVGDFQSVRNQHHRGWVSAEGLVCERVELEQTNPHASLSTRVTH